MQVMWISCYAAQAGTVFAVGDDVKNISVFSEILLINKCTYKNSISSKV